MTARRAFMRRSFFVCRTCCNYSWEDGRSCCRGEPIHWNPCGFGCGEYGESDRHEVFQVPLESWGGEHDE